MSNDRYENIRKALAMGPTPGPWSPSYDKGSTRDIFTEQGKLPVCMVRGVTYVGQEQYLANGHFIAACDPDTIRALLAERDALREALSRILENEASDWKAAEEFGGYVLDDELREEARAALAKENSDARAALAKAEGR